MKTISYWLEKLPAPHGERAIKNFKGYKGFGYAGSAAIALNLAFNWDDSPEGSLYWESVYGMCLTGNFYDAECRVKKVKIPVEDQIFKMVKVVKEVNGTKKVHYKYPSGKKPVLKRYKRLKECRSKFDQSKSLDEALTKIYLKP